MERAEVTIRGGNDATVPLSPLRAIKSGVVGMRTRIRHGIIPLLWTI